MSIPCSAAYLLEMIGRVLLKVATQVCFQSKKNRKFSIFETKKSVLCDQKNLSVFDKLECLYILQLPIFWK